MVEVCSPHVRMRDSHIPRYTVITVCQLFLPSANYYSKNYILLSDLLGKERKKRYNYFNPSCRVA